MPRFLGALTLLLLAMPFVIAQEADDAPEAETPWVSEMRDVQIPMRDGKSLAANLLLPDERGEYPCVLVQTPYDKDRMGREYGDSASEAGRGSQKAWAEFDRDNYAYVFVDWRGFYASKDAMKGVNKRKWKRGQDGYDCVEWIAKQDWCNGKVGTWGGSALGKQQFDTAAEQPPHLVCAVPLIAYQGSRYSSYYEGGVLLEQHVKSLDMLGFGVGKLVKENPLPSRLWTFIENRSYTPEKIQVPCLMISGWWDNFPRDVIRQWEDLVDRGDGKAKESKLVMGPWSHTAIDMSEQGDLEFPKAEGWSTQVTLKFFDYYLRGIEDSGWKEIDGISVFQTNEGKWVGAESWDKLKGEEQAWRLHADGKINQEKPGASTEEQPLTRQYTYDPKNASPTIGGQNLPPLSHGPKDVGKIAKRDDVLVYETAELEKPLAIRGEVELTLQFSCTRVDTDIHLRLCDDDGEGHIYLVGETIQRAKLRDGESVQGLKPGEVYTLTLRLPPHAYTWQEGHRLKLIVTGGNSPRYERNTHTGDDRWDAAKAMDVEVTLYHDAERAPELKLPVVPQPRETTAD